MNYSFAAIVCFALFTCCAARVADSGELMRDLAVPDGELETESDYEQMGYGDVVDMADEYSTENAGGLTADESGVEKQVESDDNDVVPKGDIDESAGKLLLEQVRASSSANRRNECPPGFTYIESARSCYRMILNNLQWDIAALRCKSLHEKAHLVTIGDVVEQAAVSRFVDTYSDSALAGCFRRNDANLGTLLWTAGHKLDPINNSPFVWKLSPGSCCNDVKEMRYTHFSRGEPNTNAEWCIGLFRGLHYEWHNYDCPAAACSVCEVDL